MAMDLNQLQALLSQSAAASSSSPALQDQLARANALRDTPAPTPTRGMSYTSPLQHLARGFNQIRGQGKAQRANEGLAKYRQQMADADAAKAMYGLQTTADNRQQDVDFRNQAQADTREHRLSQALAQKSQYDQTHDLSERQFSETTRSKNRDRTIEWLKYGSEQQKYKAKVALEAGRYITEQDRLDDKIELEKANRKEDQTREDKQRGDDKTYKTDAAKLKMDWEKEKYGKAGTEMGVYTDLDGKARTLRRVNGQIVDSAGNVIPSIANWSKAKTETIVEDANPNKLSGEIFLDKQYEQMRSSQEASKSLIEQGLAIPVEDRKVLNSLASRFKNLAIEQFAPDKFTALIKDQFSDYPPSIKNFLINLSGYSAPQLKELFGASFTGSEQTRAEEFAAFVKGLSYDSLMNRLLVTGKSSAEKFNSFQNRYQNAYGSSGISDLGYYDEQRARMSPVLTQGSTAYDQMMTPTPVGNQAEAVTARLSRIAELKAKLEASE